MNCIDKCRICNSNELQDVISLGEQYITSRFPKYGDFSTPKTPIDLCVCAQCRLLQLRQTTFAAELYEYEYGYRSGISNTMRQHLLEYKEEITKIVQLNDGDTIVDIGSNDSTMLQYYSDKMRRIGVDPTGSQFEQYYGNVELLPTYFTEGNFREKYGDSLKCKLVSSISMFYDLPDPVQFARDIYSILDDDGIWTCEQSYVISMLNTNSIDTICHEHLEYYALHQIKAIADKSDFKIIDVKFNNCNGGSFRVYFAKRDSMMYSENLELIHKILSDEIAYGLMDNSVYERFLSNCDNQIKYLCDFIDTVNKNGKSVYIYGASTKGNCLLQYADIGENRIKYAVERNPSKIGKMTNTGIEIISEDTMRANPPDYLLVLPWHFRSEILEREREFTGAGGQFIFPFPQFEIVGSKPKVLITGCDGMIASYVKVDFADSYLYGIARNTPSYEENITKFYFDMNDSSQLERTIHSIKPDIIIHLASISSSKYALEHPIEALNANGMIVANICDILHRNGLKSKLFNASSSEIYKGHIDYLVTEDDANMNHLHPYSIAKIMGHNMVDFYRKTYKLPFSNGIIFTTESNRKKPVFLLNKVAEHIRNWKTDNTTPLRVGNLDSYRNILHASDVSQAIKTILSVDYGDSYLICNDTSHKVFDLVVSLYARSGIHLELRDNVLYEDETPVVILSDNSFNSDSSPTTIMGECVKLRSLGWSPRVSIDHILDDLHI